MSKRKKELKLKYVLIPIAGLIGAAAEIFTCKKIRKNHS